MSEIRPTSQHEGRCKGCISRTSEVVVDLLHLHHQPNMRTTTEPPEYSHWLTIATTIALLWALIFAGVRTWGKLTRSLIWSFYDNVFTTAFVRVPVRKYSRHLPDRQEPLSYPESTLTDSCHRSLEFSNAFVYSLRYHTASAGSDKIRLDTTARRLRRCVIVSDTGPRHG